MWYDILVLAVLIYFAVRGASRGMIQQLAGITGIVLCFVFADAITLAAGPYVSLEEPLNDWVVLFGAYLVFTLISYVIAGRISDYLAKVKLKEFDSHLGAVFGFVKGVILCLIVTFLIVTMSEDAREALKKSRSGIAAARIVKTVHPYLDILPEKLVVALEKYIHLLDDSELQNQYEDHDHDHGTGIPGLDTSLGGTGNIGNSNGEVFPPGSSQSSSLDQLTQLVSRQTEQILRSAIDSEGDPQVRATLIERLINELNKDSPDRRQMSENYLQTLSQQGTGAFLNELKSMLGVTNSTAPTDSSIPGTPTPITPINNIPKREQIAALRKQIVSAYTNDPTSQLSFEQQIEGFLGTLPETVYLGVLEDWNADIWSQPDPDQKTSGQSTLEQRILRQLDKAGIPLSQLDPAMQQRLRAAGATTGSTMR